MIYFSSSMISVLVLFYVQYLGPCQRHFLGRLGSRRIRVLGRRQQELSSAPLAVVLLLDRRTLFQVTKRPLKCFGIVRTGVQL